MKQDQERMEIAKTLVKKLLAQPQKRTRFASFLAANDIINFLTNKGFSLSTIHAALLEEGLISMSYRSFLYYKKKLNNNSIKLNGNQNKIPINNSAENIPGQDISPKKVGTFVFDPQITNKEDFK